MHCTLSLSIEYTLNCVSVNSLLLGNLKAVRKWIWDAKRQQIGFSLLSIICLGIPTWIGWVFIEIEIYFKWRCIVRVCWIVENIYFKRPFGSLKSLSDQFEVSPRVNSIIIFLRYFRLCPTFIKLISTIGDLIFFSNSIVLDRLFRISFGFHFIYYLGIIISFNGIRAYLRRFGLRRIKLWKETWCQTLVKWNLDYRTGSKILEGDLLLSISKPISSQFFTDSSSGCSFRHI